MKKFLIIAVVVIALGVAAYFLFFNNADKESEVTLYNFAIEDPFITNVSNSQKLFKATIILVVDKEKMDEYFTENSYVIRDTILMILRELTEEEIKSVDTQDKLRDVISSALNKTLGIENIVSVYFGDFVMQ